MSGIIARRKSARKKNFVGRIVRMNVASTTLRSALEGSKAHIRSRRNAEDVGNNDRIDEGMTMETPMEIFKSEDGKVQVNVIIDERDGLVDAVSNGRVVWGSEGRYQ